MALGGLTGTPGQSGLWDRRGSETRWDTRGVLGLEGREPVPPSTSGEGEL